MAKRDKHIGVVVEPEMHDKLRAIADEKYMPLSTFIYSILKKWLEKKESENRG